MVLYRLGEQSISLELPDATKKELDFTDTSFFTTSPGRQLPSPAEVRALAKEIGIRPPTPLKFENLNLIVKFGPDHHVTTTEAVNLWMIKKVFGDEIPVPELFGWRVDDEDYVFIYMELIEGPTLEECWEHLSIIEKKSILDQLSRIIENLRRLEQDPSDQFIDQPRGGPFPSIKDFNDWFALLHQLRFPHRYDDPNRCLLPDTGAIKFTHADLNRRNMIVSSANPGRVFLVDWQQSGWYPDYWEYCKACYTVWYEDEWRRDYIDKFLQPWTDVTFVCVHPWAMGICRGEGSYAGKFRSLARVSPHKSLQIETIENSTGYVHPHLRLQYIHLRNMDSVYDIPTHCKAGVVVNEGPDFQVKVEMVPVPEPGPDDILIRLNVTGLCSSDIHMMKNDLGSPPMSFFGVRSPGHEGAGIVVKTGANVRNFKVGDRAGIKPLTDTCGSCDLCWGDKETYCRAAVHTGLMTAGTYQHYIVSPARYASPIPDGVSDEVAAPIMCSASTTYRSLVESGLRPGDWAVFPGGGGGVGIQGVQLAKAMGMRPIVVDTGAAKRALALEMGAEVFIDFVETDDTTAAVVAAADGIGAHGVFVTAPAAYRSALSFVGNRIGAVVMCIGLAPTKTMVVGDDPNRFIFQNLTVKGTLVGSRKDTAAALDFARRGLLKQICEVYPIDRLPEAVEKLRRGEVAGRIVVDFGR
ncbi:hypothetical protein CDV55_103555 [Aspergillus turcosus]|uniref:Enoyl reductase (ER) domain-containing protein n=1 Tax=Aspergillus turcosus TaxID=1245748 RepID=A0A397H1E2_9EURO|nr:hypothetical protein CDV55_103555 [Aspergillus turcosus]RLL96932.1 hypothetical protein CFD26_103326 [Aspergillus turcosus]